MPKRSSKREDANQTAYRTLLEATGERPKTKVPTVKDERLRVAASTISGDVGDNKNPAAVALGRLGGIKGGKARAARLSKERLREIAKKAARARWQARPK